MKTTSKISHAMILPHLGNMHSIILDALEEMKQGTFRQIAAAAGLESDQVWKRMSELERKGYVTDGGIVMCEKSHRPVTLWKYNETLFTNE